MTCKACADTFWVCEDHDDKPWNSGDDMLGSCECGAAGMPCLICNPCDEHTPPRELTGSIVILDHDGFHPHIVGGKEK